MADEFSVDRMLSWARDLYDLGARRPGSDAGAQAEAYLFGIMKGFGIRDVRLEPIDFVRWSADWSYLAVQGDGGSTGFSAEPIVYTTFTSGSGISAPIVDLGAGSPTDFEGVDLTGKIALVSYAHGYLEYEVLKAVGYYLHDPGETLSGKGQAMSWVTEEERRVYQAAVNAGAVGFVGVYPFDITAYLCFEGGNAYTGACGPIPGIGLRKSDGLRLLSLINKGACEGTVVLTGKTAGARMHNVVGIIPGRSSRVIQVTSHHDSMWPGATEDAAGVAVVLELARRAARTYAADRPPLTLAFVLEAAECLFVLGSRGHIARHRDDLIRDLVADLHIEHLAREYIHDEQGFLVPTGDIQARALFVTDAGPLIEIAREAVIAHNLRRTILMPTTTPLGVPTDASAYNKAGLPVISFISPPPYWNGLEDTWEKIAVDQLVPTATAFWDIIGRLLTTDPDLIRMPAPPTDGYILAP
jgi:Zn-dependent M28 family amino/carboxypeptidase